MYTHPIQENIPGGGLYPQNKKQRITYHDTYSIDGNIPGTANEENINNKMIKYNQDGKRFQLLNSAEVMRNNTFRPYKFRMRDFVYKSKDITPSALVVVSYEPYIWRKDSYGVKRVAGWHGLIPDQNPIFNSNGWSEITDRFCSINLEHRENVANQYDVEEFNSTVRYCNGQLDNDLISRQNEYNSLPAGDRRLFSYGSDETTASPLFTRCRVTAIKGSTQLILNETTGKYEVKTYPAQVMIWGLFDTTNATLRVPNDGSVLNVGTCVCLVAVISYRAVFKVIDDNGQYITCNSYDMWYNSVPWTPPPFPALSYQWTTLPGGYNVTFPLWFNHYKNAAFLTQDAISGADDTIQNWINTTWTDAEDAYFAPVGYAFFQLFQMLEVSLPNVLNGDEINMISQEVAITTALPATILLTSNTVVIPFIGKIPFQVLYLKCDEVDGTSKVLACNEQKEMSKVASYPTNKNFINCYFTSSASPLAPAITLADIVFHERITICIDWGLESIR